MLALEVDHVVTLADAGGHLLTLTTTIVAPNGGPLPSPLVLFMPVWTPGSYLVREYARHIEGFTAEVDGRHARTRKVRKNAFSVEHEGGRRVTVRYRLYANELTVRTNHVDATHAYWNGAATYLVPEAAPETGARVTVQVPEGWRVATALPPVQGATGHVFRARSFDELCDAPFECGPHLLRSFAALGKTHQIAIWDNADSRAVDWDKVVADTRTIVETEAALLAGNTGRPEDALPYTEYWFLWHVSPRGRGGLEHRDSATLLVKPALFATRTGYLDVLSLIAHEFFHLWNVKRIRPAGLCPYRYEQENYTRLLWWFEGGTAYYDWRVLRLAKLATVAEYLTHLAEEIARLEDTPGASVHALEETSFDAWIKAYRPDENSINSTVSYYLKGEIVCALLDLTIRHRSSGRASLDDAVRLLWNRYGKTDAPVPETALFALFAEVAGTPLDDVLTRWVGTTEPLNIQDTLALAGLAFQRTNKNGAPKASLGVRTASERGRVVVSAVPRGSAAQRAGIDPQDEIVAIGERRVEGDRLEPALSGLRPGDVVSIVVARDGRMRTLQAVLDAPVGGEAKIVMRADSTEEQAALRRAWLGGDLDAPPR